LWMLGSPGNVNALNRATTARVKRYFMVIIFYK
jgi:hypothetical protein